MAIDSSIPLQVNVPQMQSPSAMDWVKMGNLAQQNQLLQAETTNQNAQTPGITAQSTSAVLKAKLDQQNQDANDYLLELASKPENQTVDANGNTVMDPVKVYPAMMTKFPTQGGAAWKSYSDNVVGQATTSQQAQDAFTKDLAVAAATADREGVDNETKNQHLTQFVNNWVKTHPQLANVVTGLPGMVNVPGTPAVAPVAPSPAVPAQPLVPGMKPTSQQIEAGQTTPIPAGAISGIPGTPAQPLQPGTKPTPQQIEAGQTTEIPAQPSIPGSPARPAAIQFAKPLSDSQVTALSKSPMSVLQGLEVANQTTNATNQTAQVALEAQAHDIGWLQAKAGIMTKQEQAEWAAKGAAIKGDISVMNSALAAAPKDPKTGQTIIGSASGAVLRQLYDAGDSNVALLQHGLDMIPGNTNKVWEIGTERAKGMIQAEINRKSILANQIDVSTGAGTPIPKGTPIASVGPDNKVTVKPSDAPATVASGSPPPVPTPQPVQDTVLLKRVSDGVVAPVAKADMGRYLAIIDPKTGKNKYTQP